MAPLRPSFCPLRLRSRFCPCSFPPPTLSPLAGLVLLAPPASSSGYFSSYFCSRPQPAPLALSFAALLPFRVPLYFLARLACFFLRFAPLFPAHLLVPSLLSLVLAPPCGPSPSPPRRYHIRFFLNASTTACDFLLIPLGARPLCSGYFPFTPLLADVPPLLVLHLRGWAS